MNDAAIAVRPEPAALEQIRNTQTALRPATMLDRAELTFFADMITAADLIPFDKQVPREVQKYRVMAKIVAGAAHGFDPISSQENLHVIKGRCVLSARGMSVKLRRTGKYDTRVEELTGEKCRLKVLERGDDGKWYVKGYVDFTKDHAKAAGLLNSNKDMYDKWGPDMLYANALKRVCRRFAPEVLDTDPIETRLSRANALPTAEAPPQIAENAQGSAEAPAPAVEQAPEPEPAQGAPEPQGEVHKDEEYVDAAPEAELAEEAVEGDFTEVDGEVVEDEDLGLDSETENLRAATQELYDALPTAQRKDLIAGLPTIGKMDKDQLEKFYSKLQGESK